MRDAEGGNRTHTPRGEPDFESGASTSSATSAVVVFSIAECAWLSPGVALCAIGAVLCRWFVSSGAVECVCKDVCKSRLVRDVFSGLVDDRAPNALRLVGRCGLGLADERGDGFCRVLVQDWHGVGVDVEGGRDGGVSEPLGDDLGVDAGLEGEGGVGVAQVVEADA